MACVLTVVVADRDRAVVGHVGDTRLYRITIDGLEKVTRDHSPIGEREDAGEISEIEAMHHPRRNEVYRDVGSELHTATDPEFIDVHELPLRTDEAFLLCSDGLTDLVDSDTIHRVVLKQAGDPDRVAHGLIEVANGAGGKDNIAAVYSEGADFAAAAAAARAAASDTTRRHTTTEGTGASEAGRAQRTPAWPRYLSFAATLAGGALLSAALLVRVTPELLDRWRGQAATLVAPVPTQTMVRAGESINAALQSAAPGAEIVVEPGDYRERIAMVSGVRLVSQVPRGATLRLPGSITDTDAAVVATDVAGAEIRGFRIVGDATAPLGTGVLIERSSLSIVDVEIAGATRVAVDVLAQGSLNLIGSRLYDNPGTGLALRAGSTGRITHTVFGRNGTSELSAAPIVVEPGAAVDFTGNTLHGISPAVFSALGGKTAAIERDNWFLGLPAGRAATRTSNLHAGRGRR